MKKILSVICIIFPAFLQAAETPRSPDTETYSLYGPNHISLFIGDTHIDGEGNNNTIGLDYEYRVSELLGLGAVYEKAYGELDATTSLLVADIHLDNGLIFQVGPGIERRHSENSGVGRAGMLYEFEMDRFTLSPQLHWDYHEHGKNAVVVGLAFGLSF